MPSRSNASAQILPMILTVLVIAVLVTLLTQSAYGQPCSFPTSPVLEAGSTVHSPFFPPPSGTEFAQKTHTGGERVLYYLHGLGGTGTSWNSVASRTAYGGAPQYPARQVIFDMPFTYLQNASLFDAAMDIDNTLQVRSFLAQQMHGVSPEDHLLIAHSLGGMEALILDSLYTDTATFERPFGGAVLVGSAIGGSDAAMALSAWGQNGAVHFVEEACQILSNPWLWAAHLLPPLRWFPVLDPWVQQAIQSTCSGMVSPFIPFALGKFHRPLVTELTPQSPWPTHLNQRPPKIPVVQLYGVEDEPVFWRTAYSMYQTDSIGLALAQDPFQFDGDDVLVDWVSDQIAHYAAQTLLASARAQSHAIAQSQVWYNPLSALYHAWQRQRALEETAAAYAAERWYRQANGVYKDYIGAREIALQADGFWCRCRGDADPPFTWTVVSSPADCLDDDPYALCQSWPHWDVVITEHPNDGVVLASSAGSLPGAVAHIELPHTNHQQMRNSTYTRDVFKRLFNGQIPGGAFFATALR